MKTEENSLIVLSILKRLFGKSKEEYENQEQFEFNCPSNKCKRDVNKFNLNYSPSKNLFNCFKCGYKGFVSKLVKDYGSEDDIQKINILFPKHLQHSYNNNFNDHEIDETITCDLPEDYRPLTKKYPSKYYYRAMEYLKERGITMEIIKKYEIGYTESGNRKFRIIIPSRNIFGQINYYEARSFFKKSKKPYWKPDSPEKTNIIFNAANINFDLPIYLIEGPFDMFPLSNAVPMLGKILSPIILKKILQHKTKVILCLDEDAIEDTILLYLQLESLGIDVYFVDIKDDIAKHFERYGIDGIIKLLRTYKKIDFSYLFSLKMKDKKKKSKYSDKELNDDWEKDKQQFQELLNE